MCQRSSIIQSSESHLPACLDAELYNLLSVAMATCPLWACSSRSTPDGCLSYLLWSRKKSSAAFRQFLTDIASPASSVLDAGPLWRGQPSSIRPVILMGKGEKVPICLHCFGGCVIWGGGTVSPHHTCGCKQHYPEIRIHIHTSFPRLRIVPTPGKRKLTLKSSQYFQILAFHLAEELWRRWGQAEQRLHKMFFIHFCSL